MCSHRDNFFIATEDTEIFLTRVNTVFARLGVLNKFCFLSKLNRRIRLRPPDGQRQATHLLSRAKNTDFLSLINHNSKPKLKVKNWGQKNSVPYKGAKLRVWYKKTVSHRGHRAAVLDFKDFFKIFLESIEFDS